MYIYSVIPLTKLPRKNLENLNYFDAEKFSIGQLVEVPLGKRVVPAVISNIKKAKNQKQLIKKSDFMLKKINTSLTDVPIFEKNFLTLANNLSEYYYTNSGLMLQRMLPLFFSKPTKPSLKLLKSLPRPQISFEAKKSRKILVIGTQNNKEYKKYTKKESIFLVPEYWQIPHSIKLLPLKNTAILQNIRQTKLREIWKDAYLGNIKNIIGTRSALFSPLKNIQSIIIDNQNNSSYVSWDQHPKFDIRYAAENLSTIYGINLIKGDLIPSIETYYKAKKQNWTIHQNFENRPMPKIIDMKEEIKNGNNSIVSNELKKLIQSLKKDQKILFLIGRRGLASALLCRDCGYIPKCTACESSFVLHEDILICHHCGKKIQKPKFCNNCKSHRIKFLGGGTQAVVSILEKLAPHLKILRLDSDSAKNQAEQLKIFNDFNKKDYSILVGTQLALKKSLLPKIDYAVVVMLDTILSLPEYRSQERVHEIMWRLKDIARKKLFVQTYLPELPLFKHIQKNNFEKFFVEELEKRKLLSFPPYTQIIKLQFSNTNSMRAEQEAHILKKKLEVQLEYLQPTTYNLQPELLGPAPAFISKIAGKYKWYILIKWPKDKNNDIKDLHMRNRLLNIVPSDWEIIVDPINIAY